MVIAALRTWHERRQVMKELRRLQKTDSDTLGLQFDRLLQEARSALERKDLRMVREMWPDMVQRFRNKIAASNAALELQLEMRWFDEAEELLREGQARYAGEAHYAVGLALLAHRRGDLTSAIKQWALVRKRFPHDRSGYLRGVDSLLHAKRPDEAETVLLEGFRAFPNDLDCRMVYARVAEARSDWQTSQSRWQTVKDMWPDPRSLGYQMGTLNVAMNQRRLGQLDEAEAGFLSLRTVAPLNPLPAAGYAGIAEDRGDLNEAARRWKQVTSRFPSFGDGYRGLIAVLRRLGQDAEIEAALAKAVHYCVEEPHWFAGYAASAEQRGDFATAASRWKDMRTRFPQQEQAYIRGAAALAALGESAALAELRAEHVRQFTK